MVEAANNLPERSAGQSGVPEAASRSWHPFETLRREIDRLIDDFDHGFFPALRRSSFDVEPFWRREISWGTVPAVDIVEQDNAFEIAAEMPGMDEKDIEVKVTNGNLSIRGEKKSERQEKKKGYHLSERRYGSFERTFHIPEGVDPDKISAHFKNGVLTLTLPKSPSFRNPEKKIEIKSA